MAFLHAPQRLSVHKPIPWQIVEDATRPPPLPALPLLKGLENLSCVRAEGIENSRQERIMMSRYRER